jgi:hypothetical protein
MADPRREPCLIDEHRDELRLFGVLRVHALDRDGSREADRSEQPTDAHRRHAARCELVVDDVPSDGERSLSAQTRSAYHCRSGPFELRVVIAWRTGHHPDVRLLAAVALIIAAASGCTLLYDVEDLRGDEGRGGGGEGGESGPGPCADGLERDACGVSSKCTLVAPGQGTDGGTVCGPSGAKMAWDVCATDADCVDGTWCDAFASVCKPWCTDFSRVSPGCLLRQRSPRRRHASPWAHDLHGALQT